MIKASPDEIREANVIVHSRLAAVYNQTEPHFRPENQTKVRGKLEALFKQLGAHRQLDVGCGTGFVINLTRDLATEIHGVDITQAMLDQVDTSTGNITLHRHPAENLPFESGYFDIATAYSFIDHLADYRIVLKEVARVLRPGGAFYVDLIPNPAFWDAIAACEDSGRTDLSGIIQREIQAVRHVHERIEKEYGISGDIFQLAEPSKNFETMLDPDTFQRNALAAGFKTVEVEHQWFLGQGKVMHQESFEKADHIHNYLTEALPLSKHLFKYLRYTAFK